jgi:hypothetical protein
MDTAPFRRSLIGVSQGICSPGARSTDRLTHVRRTMPSLTSHPVESGLEWMEPGRHDRTLGDGRTRVETVAQFASPARQPITA